MYRILAIGLALTLSAPSWAAPITGELNGVGFWGDVPEAGSVALLAMGIAGLVLMRRKKERRA